MNSRRGIGVNAADRASAGRRSGYGGRRRSAGGRRHTCVRKQVVLSSQAMELGLATFADIGAAVTPRQRMADLIEEATLADELGLDVFAVGEHHRPDFLVSAPVVVLAAIAMRTERVRLASAVTLLSSDDPVRVFQQFAELDLLSGGRAEIMAGRGSFTESFPLFGYDLDDYDELFAEKLELLLALRDSTHVTWSGRHRPALDHAGVWPAPAAGAAAGVGGGRRISAVGGAGRACSGLPLMVAIIGGQPERFVGLVDLYRRGGERPPATTPRGTSSRSTPTPSSGRTSEQADNAFARPYLEMMNRIGRERGWPPAGRREYDELRSPSGALAVGDPEQVAEKILFEHELFGHQRYVGQMSVGAVEHRDVLRSIELFGTEVAPRRSAPRSHGAAPTARPSPPAERQLRRPRLTLPSFSAPRGRHQPPMDRRAKGAARGKGRRQAASPPFGGQAGAAISGPTFRCGQ